MRHGVGAVWTNGDVPGGVGGEIRSAPSVDSVEGGGERRRPVEGFGCGGGVLRRRDEDAGAVAGEGVDGSINESESRHLLILPSQLIHSYERENKNNKFSKYEYVICCGDNEIRRGKRASGQTPLRRSRR